MYIRVPSSEEEFNEICLGFYNIARFPRVIGCIDYTHIRVQSPVPVVKKDVDNAMDNSILNEYNNNNPPLYPSPGMDLEQELIGTSTQDILERIGTAATCLVAGIEYTHGQQIYRADPCDFCLCLDGEMFCWWQECPPAADVPCKDHYPFNGPPCNYPYMNDMLPFGPPFISPYQSNSVQDNNKSNKKATSRNTETSTIHPSLNDNATVQNNKSSILNNNNNNTNYIVPLGSAASDSSTPSLLVPSSSDVHHNNNNDNSNSESMTPSNEDVHDSTASITGRGGLDKSSTETPTVCVVMGVEYKIGEILPHDTGNCLQCICGTGARVTCSPHQCVPVEEDDSVPLYRSSGRRSDLLDVF